MIARALGTTDTIDDKRTHGPHTQDTNRYPNTHTHISTMGSEDTAILTLLVWQYPYEACWHN